MNEQAASVLRKVLTSGTHARIKLLGDSITHGAGGTGFQQNGDFIATKFYRNPDGYCWANLLSGHLAARFDCEVVNNGCCGVTSRFIINHFDELVDEKDDAVLCTIGTNDRTWYREKGPRPETSVYAVEFYERILKMNEKFRAAGKPAIFIANIPASEENEKDTERYWRMFHMSDVNALYAHAAEKCGFPFISLYRLFLDYCEKNDVSVDSLLKDGLHPNDEGHRVMAELLMRELGLED